LQLLAAAIAASALVQRKLYPGSRPPTVGSLFLYAQHIMDLRNTYQLDLIGDLYFGLTYLFHTVRRVSDYMYNLTHWLRNQDPVGNSAADPRLRLWSGTSCR